MKWKLILSEKQQTDRRVVVVRVNKQTQNKHKCGVIDLIGEQIEDDDDVTLE